jgi:hypothetical protein
VDDQDLAQGTVLSDEFRKLAEDCRQLAASERKQVDKAFWLRLAEDWLKLAQGADKPPGGQP